MADDPNTSFGIAPHSLRAVSPDLLDEVIDRSPNDNHPIHIHIAEQSKEVNACIEWSGKRPVEWLLTHCDIDHRWCLVHATHMTEAETKQLAQTGAVVGLCPSTEANLGDGLFNAKTYVQNNGCFGIGSDSQISVNPVEELRWLEYGQRLHHQIRNVMVSDEYTVPGVFCLNVRFQAVPRPVAGKSVNWRQAFELTSSFSTSSIPSSVTE